MTTPAETTTPASTIGTVISHWVTFIKAHEKLLLCLLLAAVVWHVGDKAYDAYGQHLKAVQTADNAKIAQIDQQNAKNTADLAALQATVAANAVLNQAKVVAAKQKVVVAQKNDAALPLPELSAHWQDLLVLPPGSITPQANGTVAVTTDAAHSTVNALETIPALNVQLLASQDDLKGCTAVRAQQETAITGLNNKVAAVTKAREDDATATKQALRKEYWHGFKHGFIAGVVTTSVAVIAIFK